MQTAALIDPRPAALTDLRPGDACFIIADLFAPKPPLAYLGTVTELLHGGGLRVRRETTSGVHDQGGAIAFFADGQCMMTRGLKATLEVPVGARRVGSLARAA